MLLKTQPVNTAGEIHTFFQQEYRKIFRQKWVFFSLASVLNSFQQRLLSERMNSQYRRHGLQCSLFFSISLSLPHLLEVLFLKKTFFSPHIYCIAYHR